MAGPEEQKEKPRETLVPEEPEEIVRLGKTAGRLMEKFGLAESPKEKDRNTPLLMQEETRTWGEFLPPNLNGPEHGERMKKMEKALLDPTKSPRFSDVAQYTFLRMSADATQLNVHEGKAPLLKDINLRRTYWAFDEAMIFDFLRSAKEYADYYQKYAKDMPASARNPAHEKRLQESLDKLEESVDGIAKASQLFVASETAAALKQEKDPKADKAAETAKALRAEFLKKYKGQKVKVMDQKKGEEVEMEITEDITNDQLRQVIDDWARNARTLAGQDVNYKVDASLTKSRLEDVIRSIGKKAGLPVLGDTAVDTYRSRLPRAMLGEMGMKHTGSLVSKMFPKLDKKEFETVSVDDLDRLSQTLYSTDADWRSHAQSTISFQTDITAMLELAGQFGPYFTGATENLSPEEKAFYERTKISPEHQKGLAVDQPKQNVEAIIHYASLLEKGLLGKVRQMQVLDTYAQTFHDNGFARLMDALKSIKIEGTDIAWMAPGAAAKAVGREDLLPKDVQKARAFKELRSRAEAMEADMLATRLFVKKLKAEMETVAAETKKVLKTLQDRRDDKKEVTETDRRLVRAMCVKMESLTASMLKMNEAMTPHVVFHAYHANAFATRHNINAWNIPLGIMLTDLMAGGWGGRGLLTVAGKAPGWTLNTATRIATGNLMKRIPLVSSAVEGASEAAGRLTGRVYQFLSPTYDGVKIPLEVARYLRGEDVDQFAKLQTRIKELEVNKVANARELEKLYAQRRNIQGKIMSRLSEAEGQLTAVEAAKVRAEGAEKVLGRSLSTAEKTVVNQMHVAGEAGLQEACARCAKPPKIDVIAKASADEIRAMKTLTTVEQDALIAAKNARMIEKLRVLRDAKTAGIWKGSAIATEFESLAHSGVTGLGKSEVAAASRAGKVIAGLGIAAQAVVMGFDAYEGFYEGDKRADELEKHARTQLDQFTKDDPSFVCTDEKEGKFEYRSGQEGEKPLFTVSIKDFKARRAAEAARLQTYADAAGIAGTGVALAMSSTGVGLAVVGIEVLVRAKIQASEFKDYYNFVKACPPWLLLKIGGTMLPTGKDEYTLLDDRVSDKIHLQDEKTEGLREKLVFSNFMRIVGQKFPYEYQEIMQGVETPQDIDSLMREFREVGIPFLKARFFARTVRTDNTDVVEWEKWSVLQVDQAAIGTMVSQQELEAMFLSTSRFFAGHRQLKRREQLLGKADELQKQVDALKLGDPLRERLESQLAITRDVLTTQGNAQMFGKRLSEFDRQLKKSKTTPQAILSQGAVTRLHRLKGDKWSDKEYAARKLPIKDQLRETGNTYLGPRAEAVKVVERDFSVTDERFADFGLPTTLGLNQGTQKSDVWGEIPNVKHISIPFNVGVVTYEREILNNERVRLEKTSEVLQKERDDVRSKVTRPSKEPMSERLWKQLQDHRKRTLDHAADIRNLEQQVKAMEKREKEEKQREMNKPKRQLRDFGFATQKLPSDAQIDPTKAITINVGSGGGRGSRYKFTANNVAMFKLPGPYVITQIYAQSGDVKSGGIGDKNGYLSWMNRSGEAEIWLLQEGEKPEQTKLREPDYIIQFEEYTPEDKK